MKVKITNGRVGTWYENEVGNWFEVINDKNKGPFKLQGVHQVDSNEYQLIIGEDCESEFANCMGQFDFRP